LFLRAHFFQGRVFFKGVFLNQGRYFSFKGGLLLLRAGYFRAGIKGVYSFKVVLFHDVLFKGAFGEASMPHFPLDFRVRQNLLEFNGTGAAVARASRSEPCARYHPIDILTDLSYVVK
jgi:hypothetical protein